MGLRSVRQEVDKQERIRDIIEMVELEGFEPFYPHQLSGGMQRRAELARALVVNPDVLFMDEPFSGLDFLTHMKMREEVVNLHEYMPRTTLMVTHDIDDALIMGDRVVVMGSRPSSIKFETVLDFPRPRVFDKGTELHKLRSDVFLMLGGILCSLTIGLSTIWDCPSIYAYLRWRSYGLSLSPGCISI